MVVQKYRWDFIGLSSQAKPTPATSNKVVDGSTFYESDTSKLYVFCKGTWYERKPLGGGGSGGTDDFEQLTNRPKYNGVTMTGDTNIPEVVSYSDFTGATSETAGTNGLVPAPTTSDVNKFLKGDGTWDTAGSSYTLPIASDSELGGIKVGSNLTINSSTGVLDATDTTYSAFTGTDGTSAGAAGLVPAPATTDAGRFLKADGTWANAGGSAVTQLTSADLNYPATGTKTTLATWSLVPGNYSFYNDSGSDKTLKMAADSSMQFSVKAGETIDFSVQRVGWSLTSDSVYLVRTYVATNNKIYAAIAYNTNGNVPDGSASTRDSIILTQHNITDTTGTSTTDVMSQNAVTEMVYNDPSTRRRIRLGDSASAGSNDTIAFGRSADASATGAIAIGTFSSAHGAYSVALGRSATTTVQGQFDIGVGTSGVGYNSSNYRLLTGLYEPQSVHDAATKGYVDGLATIGTLSTTPTGTTAGTPGRLYSYDSGGGTYEVWLCVHDNGDNTYVWKQLSLI